MDEAYTKVRSEAITMHNIESSWRGGGSFSFNPQRALRATNHEIPKIERPKTPTEFDIFD
jgi:hypothetical protein